jgi:hypothetical protein
MAARSILQFLPEGGRPFGANFPEYQADVNGYDRVILAFDDSTDEYWVWSFVAPVGITTPLTAKVIYRLASDTNTSHTVQWSIAIEAFSDGEVDTDAGSSFDTENAFTAQNIPGTAGHTKTASLQLTNVDSIAAGDLCRLRLLRDVSGDDASGDAEVFAVEIQDNGG